MRVVFITSTFDHYHLPLCKEAYEQLGNDFVFIATKPMPDSMKKLGFTDFSTVCPYVLNAFENEENGKRAQELCDNADMVIIGATTSKFVEDRLKTDKLTFRFSERIFKKGYQSLLKPKNVINLYKDITQYRKNDRYYILCTGFYAAKDFKILGMRNDKLLRWAYFSAVKEMTREYNDNHLNIIWTGRFVELKHPEYALEAALRLKNENIKFSMNFIGMGPLQEKMQSYIDEHQLRESVKILGSMPTEEVQKHMDAADISLFTSDRREGWGAVVNEAMVGGCAVVASSAAGSSKSLIKNGENGFVFDFKDKEKFFDCVLNLAKDHDLRKRIGVNANKTMCDEWNGQLAMRRLLEITRCVLEKEDLPIYVTGPCSKAL